MHLPPSDPKRQAAAELRTRIANVRRHAREILDAEAEARLLQLAEELERQLAALLSELAREPER